MNLKKILLAALAAVGLAFTSQAEVDLGAIKTLLVPDDAIGLVEDSTKGEFTYSYVDANGVKHYVTIFASTGDHTWPVPAGARKIDYLAVGGGGSGGCGSGGSGGGGGAGGMLENTVAVETGDVLSITVGAGGAGVSVTGSNSKVAGNNGEDSAITNGETEVVHVYGGGGGGGGGSGSSSHGAEPKPGGSGGGSGGAQSKQYNGAQPIDSAQGNAGGGKDGKVLVAGGGGGAGEAGSNGAKDTACPGGKGGDGRISTITGKSNVYYAGGGGGGGRGTVSVRSEGGLGGGGKGGISDTNSKNSDSNRRGLNGTDGLGGGGGGMYSGTGSNYYSGSGGSGIVVLSYTKASFSVAFSWNADKVAFTAVCDEADISSATSVDDGSTIVMTAKPYAGYSYEGVALDGWELDAESGAITKTIVVCEAIDVMVPEPEQTGPVVTLVEVTLAEIANAELTAEVDGAAVLSGNKVPKDSIVFAKVTPVEHYVYTTAPAGWDFAEDGAITNYIVAASDPTAISVEAPSAIMLKVNYPAFGTGTVVIRNGEDVVQDGASVLEGTELTVTVTPAEGYEYDVEPEGWTKVGNAITKAFTITEEFTPTIPEMKPIPRYTLTLDEVANGSIAVEGGLATDYLRGTQVTLTASAATGYVLGYWTGAAAGKNASVTVTMDADKTVGAMFRSAEIDAVLSQYNYNNNLIAMWDCQDAGGISTNGWKDTMGRYTFYWNDPEKVNLPTGNALGISFGENGWGQMNTADCNDIFTKDNSNNYLISRGVMEFVIKGTPKENQAIFERATNYIICRYYGDEENPYVLGKGKGHNVMVNFDKWTHTISLDYGPSAAWNDEKTYLDGVVGSLSEDTSPLYNPNQFNGWGAYLGRASGDATTANSPFKGKILAVRFYKAHLTAEQAAANAALDKKRFGKKAGFILLIN